MRVIAVAISVVAGLAIAASAAAPPAGPASAVPRTAPAAPPPVSQPSAEPVEALIARLKSPEALARASAAQAIAVRAMHGDRSPQAVLPLIALLKDADAEARGLAAVALGFLGDARAVEPLLPVVKDRENQVRGDAIGALGRLGGPRAVETLLALVKDADWRVRCQAMRALATAREVRAMPLCVAALKDPQLEVRVQAAETLGEIGDRSALSALSAASLSNDAPLAEAAGRAISRISEGGEKGRSSAAAKRLAETMSELRFEGLPMQDVMQFVRDVSSVNVYVFWRPLASAGVTPSTPVTVNLKNVPLNAALRTILRSAEKSGRAGYMVKDNVVIVSTEEDLQALDRAAAPQAPPSADAVDRAAWQKLEKIVSLGLRDVALSDVVTYIGNICGVKVELDRAALQGAGTEPSAPVRVKLENVPAAAALRLILCDVAGAGRLTWTVMGGVVRIVPSAGGQAPAPPRPKTAPSRDPAPAQR